MVVLYQRCYTESLLSYAFFHRRPLSANAYEHAVAVVASVPAIEGFLSKCAGEIEYILAERPVDLSVSARLLAERRRSAHALAEIGAGDGVGRRYCGAREAGKFTVAHAE